jgi:hypothetical protein
MRAAMQKMRSLQQDANRQIEAALTADQKAKLPQVVKDCNNLRQVGIPLQVAASLKLTADQRKQLGEIAAKAASDTKAAMAKAQDADDPETVRQTMGDIRRQAHDAALALLTDDQKAIVKKATAGRRGPGGPGFGPPPDGQGPPPGGPGGPPPDGNGGPPPAQEGNGQ